MGLGEEEGEGKGRGVCVRGGGGVWCGWLGLGRRYHIYCTFIASLHSLLYSHARSHCRPPHWSASPRFIFDETFRRKLYKPARLRSKLPYRARLRRDSITTTHPRALTISRPMSTKCALGAQKSLVKTFFVTWRCVCAVARFCFFL